MNALVPLPVDATPISLDRRAALGTALAVEPQHVVLG